MTPQPLYVRVSDAPKVTWPCFFVVAVFIPIWAAAGLVAAYLDYRRDAQEGGE